MSSHYAWFCILYCHLCLLKKHFNVQNHLFRIKLFFTMNYGNFLCPWMTCCIYLLKSIYLLGCWSLANKSWSGYKPEFLSPWKHGSDWPERLPFFSVYFECHRLSLNKKTGKRCAYILPEQCKRKNSTLVSAQSVNGIVCIDTRLNLTLKNIEAAEGSFMIYVMY